MLSTRPVSTRLEMLALEERALMAWSGLPPVQILPSVPASPIAISSSMTSVTRNASITSGEVDYYSFVAPTSGVYTFNATTQTSELDTHMALYRQSDGNLIQSNNNINANNTDSSFQTTVLAGTKYIVAVTNVTGSLLGTYSLNIQTSGPDDMYENNDTPTTARNLGAINNTTRTISNLVMRDQADWFRFNFSGLSGAGSSVSINFQHSQGDLDLQLFDIRGNLIRTSDSTSNSETVQLDGIVGSSFFIKVYGFSEATNPSYNLSINMNSTPIPAGSRILYLNFDGANISRAVLNRISAGWGDPSMADYFDADSNGITISRLLSGRSDREQIISRIMQYVQEDVRQFGIRVYRHRGSAIVENRRATTIFLGPSTLSNGFHIACDIDTGNNNPTDIAFVGDEDWGSAADTAMALADVALHEAGHTWGLWHVASGTDLETMGMRYNNPQSFWLKNTSFLDVTYTQYQNHGPGPINTFQTMKSNFGLVSAVGTPTFTVNPSAQGSLSIQTYGSGADQIEVEKLDTGSIEVRINNKIFRVTDPLTTIRIQTNGDDKDTVKVINDLGGLSIQINDPNNLDGKISEEVADVWKGLPGAHETPGTPCSCPTCSQALYPVA